LFQRRFTLRAERLVVPDRGSHQRFECRVDPVPADDLVDNGDDLSRCLDRAEPVRAAVMPNVVGPTRGR
jgi:hypothetical protein